MATAYSLQADGRNTLLTMRCAAVSVTDGEVMVGPFAQQSYERSSGGDVTRYEVGRQLCTTIDATL